MEDTFFISDTVTGVLCIYVVMRFAFKNRSLFFQDFEK